MKTVKLSPTLSATFIDQTQMIFLTEVRADTSHRVFLGAAELESFLAFLRSLTNLDHRIPRLTVDPLPPEEKETIT